MVLVQRLIRLSTAALALAALLPGCTSHGVPYADPSANGYIGLCDKAGKQITHGKVSDAPFAAFAISSVPARPPYDGFGKVATLYAYLPLQGYAAQEWAGDQITAGAYYTNAAHPMVATASDEGAQLAQFVKSYPPKWDGLVQLRIYLSVPGQPTYNLRYPATDIRVKGDTWSVVQGGEVACDSGSAVSVNVTSAPPSATSTPSP